MRLCGMNGNRSLGNGNRAAAFDLGEHAAHLPLVRRAVDARVGHRLFPVRQVTVLRLQPLVKVRPFQAVVAFT